MLYYNFVHRPRQKKLEEEWKRDPNNPDNGGANHQSSNYASQPSYGGPPSSAAHGSNPYGAPQQQNSYQPQQPQYAPQQNTYQPQQPNYGAPPQTPMAPLNSRIPTNPNNLNTHP